MGYSYDLRNLQLVYQIAGDQRFTLRVTASQWVPRWILMADVPMMSRIMASGTIDVEGRHWQGATGYSCCPVPCNIEVWGLPFLSKQMNPLSNLLLSTPASTWIQLWMGANFASIMTPKRNGNLCCFTDQLRNLEDHPETSCGCVGVFKMNLW